MTIRVNGIELATSPEMADGMLAAHELLRQRAVETGLLAADERDEITINAACEALLAREVVTPAPDEAECRRYYEAHPGEFSSGDLMHVRHILFQVTQGTPVPQLRAKAEEMLRMLLAAPDRFTEMAEKYSNCPSSKQGGNLGQLSRGDSVPEFEKAVFKLLAPIGVMRELVKTRFGFHIVSVDRRIRGEVLPFETVRARAASCLTAAVEERAVRQYLSVLAARASLEGGALDAATSPLLQ